MIRTAHFNIELDNFLRPLTKPDKSFKLKNINDN